VDNKHNTETLRNGYQIAIFQGGPPHEPYFITIDNRGQVTIGPNKKIVATYVVGELEVFVKIVDDGLNFYFHFLFYFSIFRTTRVRGYQSCCHISHNLMV